MSGSNSSAPASDAKLEPASPLSFTVHSMPSPGLDDVARRTAAGRLKMLLILLVCAAPVIASYLTYFVFRPEGRNNYGELIDPQRAIPADAAADRPAGAQRRSDSRCTASGCWWWWPAAPATRPARSACGCSASCARRSVARQDRLDKVWLVDDDAAAARRDAAGRLRRRAGHGAARSARRRWRSGWQPAGGHQLEQHFYLVDPMGNWMMRAPGDPEPARLKRDLERLLRASAAWDLPGRP